jgi:branched-chain amino acid aminotransferase
MINRPVWKLHKDSSLEPVTLPEPPASLNAASRGLPGGVYSTFRTYPGNRILPFIDHIRRLEESAGLVGHPIRINENSVRSALRRVIIEFNEQNLANPQMARIRMSLDLEQEPGSLYFVLEPLVIPSEEDYRSGVAAVTFALQREKPQAKHTAFITAAEIVRTRLPAGAYEGLLIDDERRILEGLSSNFYAVKDGELWTANEGVLFGIARSMLLKPAHQMEIPIRFECIFVSELSEINEAFITSSSRGVVPLRQIDDVIIGEGPPGPMTLRLSQAVWQATLALLEEI